MRRVLLVVLLVPACGGLGASPVPCDEAACAALCDAEQQRAASFLEPGGEVMTAYEAMLLAPLRDEVSAGPRFSEVDPLVLCRGASRCEEVIRPEASTPLPAGPYVVRLGLELPSVGTWPIRVERGCSHDGYDEPVTRTLELVARDRTVVLDPLETFSAPVAATVPGRCVVRVDAGPGKVAELRFSLVPSGQVRRPLAP